MLLLVIVLVVYICIKFRYKRDDERKVSQTTGNWKLETLMIGVPFLLLAYFFYETVATEKAVLPPVAEGRQPDVIITGHQWWWEVEYPKTESDNSQRNPFAGRQTNSNGDAECRCNTRLVGAGIR